MQGFQLGLHGQLQLGVERARRFVKQEQPRLDHQGAGDADALSLPTRELADFALREGTQPDPLQHRQDLALDVLPLQPPDAQTVGDVLKDVEMGEEGKMLEDHGEIALVGEQPGDVSPGDDDGPFVGGSSPAMMRSVVVFPLPLGPIRETNSPSLMARSRSRSTTVSPNLFETSIICRYPLPLPDIVLLLTPTTLTANQTSRTGGIRVGRRFSVVKGEPEQSSTMLVSSAMAKCSFMVQVTACGKASARERGTDSTCLTLALICSGLDNPTSFTP